MPRKAKAKPIVRPYSTHYYTLVGDAVPSAVAWGACKTDRGAIRAAVPRVFDGSCQKALIHDRRDGTLLYTIRYDASGLKVYYGREVALPESAPLRRVK